MGMVVAAGLLALCSACGSTEPEADPDADRQEQADEQAARDEAAAAQEESRARQQQQTFDACAKTTRPLTNALGEVDSRLAIGMTNSEYGSQLGDVRVVYDRLVDSPQLKRLAPQCINKVAVPLENAFNDYVEVYGDWSDCIQDSYCDFNDDERDAKAQKRWSDASTKIDRAKRGLGGLQP